MALSDKIAGLKRLEAEILADAKAEAKKAVAETRGDGPRRLFAVVNLSDMEDGDWSAQRYVPEAQAAVLERALDRPTAAGIVSAAGKLLAEGKVVDPVEGRVNLSRRTMAILKKSELAACQAENPQA